MKFIAFASAVITIAGIFMFPMPQADAFSLNGYFGGSIVNVTYCTCVGDLGMMLTIKPPGISMVKNIFYKPGLSRLRANYNVFTSGPYVLGSYTRVPRACMMQGTVVCAPVGFAEGTIDSIIGVGTSVR